MKLYSRSIFNCLISLILIMLSGIIISLAVTVWAHGPLTGKGYREEVEKGAHGGQVVKFGVNYLEFTVNQESGDIALFLLDKNMKAISMPESYSGIIFLKMHHGSSEWYGFNRVDENSYSYLKTETGIKEIGSFNVLVGLKIGEKRKNFHFTWSPDGYDG